MRQTPLLALAALAATLACTPEKPEAARQAIVIAVGEQSQLPVPVLKATRGRTADDEVADLLFLRLASLKAGGSTSGDSGFEPELARSWTRRDSVTLVFELDPRARWHDGKPVTARDVQYSFRAFVDPKVASPVAPLLSNLDSVSVRDSLTAVVWFKKHTPEQFYDVAYQLIVMPEHVYGSIPMEQLHSSEATRHLIGSGQFRLKEWKPGE